MATCAHCGTTIIFGGVRDGANRFCNAKCHEDGVGRRTLDAIAAQIPKEVLDEELLQVHQGACPKCQGNGPVDVHTSYLAWSALVITSWDSKMNICCRKCAIKSHIGYTLLTAVVGWWGLPWGLIMTPVQLFRNVAAIFKGPDPKVPSWRLEQFVLYDLAARIATNHPDFAGEQIAPST